jgi:hypothetical protein
VASSATTSHPAHRTGAFQPYQLRSPYAAAVVPQPHLAADGGHRGIGRAHPVAGKHVDLDAGLAERAQDTGLVRTVSARASEDHRCPALGRVHGGHASS